MSNDPVQKGGHLLSSFLAIVIWIVGATASSFVALSVGTGAGIATMAVAAALSLALLRRSLGWNSLPMMLILVGLQAPAAYWSALYELSMYPTRHYSTLDGWTWWGFIIIRGTLFWSLLAATPIVLALRADISVLPGLKRFAPKVLPVVSFAAVALVCVSAVRGVQRPAPDRYVASLPVLGVIPPPGELTCVPLQMQSDPEHHRYGRSTRCATPDILVGRFAFHYDCELYVEDGRRSCDLFYRNDDGKHAPTGVSSYGSERESSVLIARDDGLDTLFTIEKDGYAQSIGKVPEYRIVDLHRLASLPTSWTIIAMVGLLVALLAVATRAVVSRLARTRVSKEWLETLAQDTALIAIGALVLSAAPLFAGLLSGMLL